MKFRPTLLLCGAVLIASVPLWADSIPYPGSVKASSGVEIFAREANRSVVRVNAPLIGAVRAEHTPAMLPIDNFDENRAFDVLNSRSLVARKTIFPSPSGLAIRSASLNDLDSFEHVSAFWHRAKAWGKEKNDNDNDDNDNTGTTGNEPNRPLVAAAVAEPGSLSLLLLGLVAVGSAVRRRKNVPLTT
jgi:hypothetical protein